ncbi:MAG TPA: PDDEXK nuclease domain-containing protein [Microlunatus sp.]
MPTWYPELLDSIAGRITTGRQRATARVNAELIGTYWAIGRDILDRQEQEGYGTKVIDRLSADLRERFPDAKGYSPRNLKYMRKFAEAWPDLEVVQRSVAQLPWRHQIALLEKLDRADQRLWYAAHAVADGWSRDILALQIDLRLHERAGKAITNFAATMPPADSDMAQQATKDPYVFDFLDVSERSREGELETGLVEHIGKFLLELGQGFAFVGRQVRLEVEGDEFYRDLLFYHLKLRRYVVIELKAVRFAPGFLGQLGMYMAAVDDLIAHPDDQPTIGLLLCKGKNNLVAEWALRGYNTPIGVADWSTAITTALPEELASSLPSIEEIEAELSDPGLRMTDETSTD